MRSLKRTYVQSRTSPDYGIADIGARPTRALHATIPRQWQPAHRPPRVARCPTAHQSPRPRSRARRMQPTRAQDGGWEAVQGHRAPPLPYTSASPDAKPAHPQDSTQLRPSVGFSSKNRHLPPPSSNSRCERAPQRCEHIVLLAAAGTYPRGASHNEDVAGHTRQQATERATVDCVAAAQCQRATSPHSTPLPRKA